MKLKLKEDPREWQKFAAVLGVLACVLTFVLVRKGWVPEAAWWVTGAVVTGVIGSALLHPAPWRAVYRAGMQISFRVGQVVGGVLLTLLFLFLVTPLGWLLRLSGKDLLNLKRKPEGASYWQPARDGRQFDRMF